MSTKSSSFSSFKATLLAATLGIAAIGGAYAGGAGQSGDGPRRDPAERMAKYLSLDDSQKTNVSAIFEHNRPANEALRERSRANHEALRALKPGNPDYSSRAQALADEAGTLERDRVLQRTQVNAELSTVLTPEQMTKMQARHEHGGAGGGWRHHGGRDGHDKPAPEEKS